MGYTEIQTGRSRYRYLLYIWGIPEAFYSGPTAPAVSTTWPFVATSGLLEWRPEAMTISPLGGIIQGGGGTVTVAINRLNSANTVLLRRHTGATRTVTLATTIEQEVANTSVVVNESIADWPASGYLWVGQECMAYNAKNNGTKTFTVLAAGRGYFNSPVQKHVADVTRGWAPRITSECVAWDRRPVSLRVFQERTTHTGVMSTDFIEELSGYISDIPEARGVTIDLRLAPWVELLKDGTVGGKDRTTTLQTGAHVFDGTTAYTMKRLERWDEGAVLSERVAVQSNAGTAALLDVVYEAHADVYDPTGTGLPGMLKAAGADLPNVPSGYVGSAVDGTGDISLASNLAGNVTASSLIENQLTIIERDAEIYPPGAAALLQWPGEALAAVNAAWAPGTNKGDRLDSAYADARIVPNHEAAGGPAIVFELNSSKHRLPLKGWINLGGSQYCWYGLHLADPSVPLATREEAPNGTDRWRKVELVHRAGSDSSPPDVFPIIGIPDAFCQEGENYVYVADDVFSDPTAAQVWLRARCETYDGKAFDTGFRVTAIATADSMFPGAPGYVLTIHPRDRLHFQSFGAWPGRKAPEITQVIAWNQADPRVVLLQLLTSEYGEGYNHPTYDVLPLGAGLDSQYIDVGSFLRFPLPTGPGAEWTDDTNGEAINLAEYLGKILEQINGLIVMRLDRATGTRKLALVPGGRATVLESSGSIDDEDWATSGRPATLVNKSIINSLSVKAGFRGAAVPININDRDSISAHRGRIARKEYVLPGVDVGAVAPGDLEAAFIPWAAEIFSQYGYERTVVAGTISYRDGLLLDCGSVVVVAADGPGVYDDDGSEGISAKPGRILMMERRPSAQTCRIEVEYDNARGTGWAPSMQVTATPAVDQVTVAVNAYSEATDPITGASVTDADFFAVGQKVWVIPLGAAPGFVTELTITVKAGNTFTFDGVHNLGANFGDIQPADWDDATAHQGYAFQADSANTLGAAGTEAKDFA